MKIRYATCILLLAFVAGVTFAHGNKKHVFGTVEKVTADSVSVKTADGKLIEVKLVAATVFVLRSAGQDKPAKLADLATGDHVVIHATPKGNTLEADEIKFSEGAASGAATSAAKKPK
jgi:hypothetical protein